MRNGFLGSLAALALGGGLALAQPSTPAPVPRPAPGWGAGSPTAPVLPPDEGRLLPARFGPTLDDLDTATPIGVEAPATAPAPPPARPSPPKTDHRVHRALFQSHDTPAQKPAVQTAGSPPAAQSGSGQVQRTSYGPALEDADLGPPLATPADPGCAAPCVQPPQEGCDEECFWFHADYLLWWFQKGPTPPLVTIGGNGVLGSPGTSTAVGNLGFDNDPRSGGRFMAGYHFANLPDLGVEGSFFMFVNRPSEEDFRSSGSPVLGRPFFNAALGIEDVLTVATPGSPGSVEVRTRSDFWGLDANLALGVCGNCSHHLTFLGGGRYLQLTEDLDIGSQFITEPQVPVFSSTPANVSDRFFTRNKFTGAQFGAEYEYVWGTFILDVRGLIAVGGNNENVAITGSTQVGGENLPVGLLAAPTNSGTYHRSHFSYVPQGYLNLGWQLTRHLRATFGYSFLYWDNVARPGGQIDRVVNPNLIPTAVGPGSPGGPARPTFQFHDADFWAQGINAGLEFHY